MPFTPLCHQELGSDLKKTPILLLNLQGESLILVFLCL